MTMAIRELAVNELDMISGGANVDIEVNFFGFGVSVSVEGNQTCIGVIGSMGPDSYDGVCKVPKGRPA
jgi:hypothetical protein